MQSSSTPPNQPAIQPADLISRMAQTRILVVGDIMLDRFVYGDVTRISPEAPVPVLKVRRDTHMLGGSGNVIANLRGLGVATDIVSLIGLDAHGRDIGRLLESLGAATGGLIETGDRPTILKTRFLAGTQQVLRVDEEKTDMLHPATEQALIDRVLALLPGSDAVILSDYDKGVLTPRVVAATITAARAADIPVLVDPKGTDYSRYAGAQVVTPNRKELADATGGMPTETDTDVIAAAQALLTNSGIAAVVATRSQDGMTVLDGTNAPLHLRAEALEVFDVSGAGDTVIATIAAALAAGANLAMAARLANHAGAIVVAKVGTAAITAAELLDRASAGVTQGYAASWQQAHDQIQRWQAQGLKVGFTNGCFDILHAGHVNYLNEARQLCDRLVVGLNHDASVRLLKGPTRPVNGEADRAVVLNGLGAVDLVVLFGAERDGQDNTPCALLETLKPDLFVKGGDYEADALPETRVVRSYGGDVRMMGLTEGRSTTGIIARINGQ